MSRVLKNNLNAVGVIAAATAREAIRSRLLWSAVFFAVVLVALSIVAASISVWERSRLIVDVGLAAASAIGSFMVVALMITSFASELKNRTAYPLLVRPTSRSAFVLGKFVGVLATMELVATIMVLATALTVLAYGSPVPSAVWVALWLTWVELAVAAAVALVFSTMASPVLAACYTGAVLVAGNLANDMAAIARRAEANEDLGLSWLLRIAHALVPDLSALSVRSQAANDLPVALAYTVSATGYGLVYAAAMLTLAAILFERRKVL